MGTMTTSRGQIHIITGERCMGKTDLCTEIVQQARNASLDVRGVLSPGRFEPAQEHQGGHKTGIYVQEIATGEKRLMARRRTGDEMGETEGMLLTPNWAFDSQVLQWGNTIFAELDDSTSIDLLVVDEIGPLELDRQLGWMEAVKRLDRGQFRTAVVVVRDEYVEMAQKRWPNSKVFLVDGSVHQRSADLIREIVS